jgi:hypothetical protein
VSCGRRLLTVLVDDQLRGAEDVGVVDHCNSLFLTENYRPLNHNGFRLHALANAVEGRLPENPVAGPGCELRPTDGVHLRTPRIFVSFTLRKPFLPELIVERFLRRASLRERWLSSSSLFNFNRRRLSRKSSARLRESD